MMSVASCARPILVLCDRWWVLHLALDPFQSSVTDDECCILCLTHFSPVRQMMSVASCARPISVLCDRWWVLHLALDPFQSSATDDECCILRSTHFSPLWQMMSVAFCSRPILDRWWFSSLLGHHRLVSSYTYTFPGAASAIVTASSSKYLFTEDMSTSARARFTLSANRDVNPSSQSSPGKLLENLLSFMPNLSRYPFTNSLTSRESSGTFQLASWLILSTSFLSATVLVLGSRPLIHNNAFWLLHTVHHYYLSCPQRQTFWL